MNDECPKFLSPNLTNCLNMKSWIVLYLLPGTLKSAGSIMNC